MGDLWAVRLDLEGWLAQFRHYSTTTTQLTYAIPPKSSLIGLLCAKIGLMREDYSKWPKEYLGYMQKVKVAISCKSKPRKYIDYVLYKNKDKEVGPKPTNIEYISLPNYSIVYLLPEDDEIFGLANKKAVLTYELFKSYLGNNECPVSIKTTEISCTERKLKELETSFAIPKKIIESLDYEDVSKILIEAVPLTPPEEVGFKPPEELVIPLGTSVKARLKEETTVYESDGQSFVVI